MIFKLTFDDKTEYVQATSWLHLFQCYEREYDGFYDIVEATELSDEEAKYIMLTNPDYTESNSDEPKEWSVYDAVVGEDFCIIGSTEWN